VTLVGYVDTTSIDQAVVDALRGSGSLFTSSYLKAVDKVCRRHSNAMAMVPGYYATSPGKADARLAAYETRGSRFVADLKAVKAPKKWQAFRAASVADMGTIVAAMGRLSTTVSASASGSTVVAGIRSYRQTVTPVSKRANRRFEARGLHRCGSQF
jgi:hypothetical protein